EAMVIPESEDYQEALKRQLDQLRVPEGTLRVERLFKEGDPAAEIAHTAQETCADLIVMGTHGRTGLERMLMGSVAEQVVRRAPCSVLVAKMPKRITVPQQAKSAASEMPMPAEAMQGASLTR